jgi:hypothetical protein
MIEINLETKDGVLSYNAPSNIEELKLKHFSMYMIYLKGYHKELDKLKTIEDLSVDQKTLLTNLAGRKFELQLIALMLNMKEDELGDIIGFEELEKLSEEFEWIKEINLEAPEDEVLENLPDVLTLNLGDKVYELETDLDNITIGAWHKIEEVLAITASDYFAQLHYVLSIMILAKDKVYDLNKIQELAEVIFEEVNLTEVWELAFFLGYGKEKYTMYTKVYSHLMVQHKGTELMKKISGTVFMGSHEGFQKSGDIMSGLFNLVSQGSLEDLMK